MRRIFGTLVSLLLFLSVVLALVLLFQQPKVEEPLPSRMLGDRTAIPWDFPGSFRDGVGLFTIYGPLQIESAPGLFRLDASGADMLVRRLERFVKNKNIKALVLRINSPGGAVGASQEIYEAVRRVRRSGIPVVASFGDVAASGGYYIACAADSIVANRGSVTGSIGVIIGSVDLSRLLKRWDIGFNIIKSKEHKDILAYWREMTPKEREILQTTVNRIYGQFLSAVSEGRRMNMADVEKLADGSIMSGEEAVKAGLVDRLGTLSDATALAAQLAGIEGDPHVIQEIPAPIDLVSALFSAAWRPRPAGGLDGLSMEQLPVSYMYDPSGGALSASQFTRLLAALVAQELP